MSLLRRWWQPTLTRRVVAALLIAFSLVWAVLVVFQYAQIILGDRDEGPRNLMGFATSVLRQVDRPEQAQAIAAAVEAQVNELHRAAEAPGSLLLQLQDRETQRILFSSADAGPALLAGSAGQGVVQTLGGTAYRVVSGETPRWALRVGVPEYDTSWMLIRLGRELTSYLLIAFPCVLLPIWLAVSRGLRPLRQFSQHIAQRSADHLAPLAIEPKHAELKPLAQALDALLDKLRTKVAREHAFVQDAAHELRTPMAVISAQAHVLALATEAQERRDAEQRLDRAIARASHLVQQLLQLAQADRPSRCEASGEIDVAQLVRQELAQWAPAAMMHRLDLWLDAPDALHWPINPAALQTMLHNLLDNALRYVPPERQLAVDLSATADELVLQVADDGPGIAEAERELVFERFYRVAGHDAPGSGLGLAIVRQTASAHGGCVTLGPGLGGRGCRFTVKLPRRGQKQ